MRHTLALSLLLLAGATACGRGDRSNDRANDRSGDRSDTASAAGVKVSFDSGAARAADEPLGPGDVRVTSTDGAVILSLVGDSVRMQLSDSLRNKVKQQLDTANDGFAGLVTRSVSGVVSSAMGFVVRVPVRDIEEARFEDGEIKLRSRGGKGNFNFSMGGDNGGRGHSSFSRADGERFVAAVNARRAALNR